MQQKIVLINLFLIKATVRIVLIIALTIDCDLNDVIYFGQDKSLQNQNDHCYYLFYIATIRGKHFFFHFTKMIHYLVRKKMSDEDVR